MGKILVIDDDEMICDTMLRVFQDMGHDVKYALTLAKGLKTAESQAFDVVFLDVRLPDGNGLERLPAIQAVPSKPEVIIITGYADSDSATIAIENNAWDYIKKPAPIDTIELTLKRALRYREEKLAARSIITLKREKIIGASPNLMACLDLAARAAGSNASIFIFGETGTGKELFARAIHDNSAHSENNFVVVDCGALPETLTESILFGYTKGAFTGADQAKDGLVKQADKGTLFLDEIGELAPAVQKAFLRVLQEHRFRPIGAKKEIESDFRLVAASNRNLEEMVTAGKFRQDLLYRISAIKITLPPLSERTQDIKELTVHHTGVLCDSYKIEMKGFSTDFFDVLAAYSWPGNVRELFSALEWAIAQAPLEPTLFAKHLPPHIRIHALRSDLASTAELKPSVNATTELPAKLPRWKAYRNMLIEEGETRYLQTLIVRTDSDIKKAAVMSGLSRPRLYELLRKYKITAR
ncbi:sigma-54 dependent transcriptional regulator [Desulfococcaceae bacterium HSG9]|nr:sigma-54 dependent transcriptional regulator [Desulfococcaceae bacterium HSG9]